MTALSLLIVYMSVGATIMHCMRTDTSQIVSFATHCPKEHSCCEKTYHGRRAASVKGNCMQYHQLRLSPFSISQDRHFDFTPTLFALPNPILTALPEQERKVYINKYCRWKYVPHSPPRAYLAFIQVLLI